MRPAFRLCFAALVLLTIGWFYGRLANVPHLKELLQHASPVQQHLGSDSRISASVLEFVLPTPRPSVGAEDVVLTKVQEQDPVETGGRGVEGELEHAAGLVETSTAGLEAVETEAPTGATDRGSPIETAEAISVTATTGFTAAVGNATATRISDSTSTSLPAVDINTPKEYHEKVVVMGALSTEDTAWATSKLKDWGSAIYIVDDTSAPLHTSRNKGREANAYLSYIIAHYENLPTTIAFVHSHEKGWPTAWHTDARGYSNVESLNALNTAFVQRNGYANLRCMPTPGCPEEIVPFREPKDESRTSEVAFAAAWKEIFGNEEVPDAVGAACCAQFAVSREQVQKRTKEDYKRMHRWLMETQLDDDTSGRVFEYLWHVIFGQDAVYCPSVNQCYKDVYNSGPRD